MIETVLQAKFKAKLDYWAKDRNLAEFLRNLQDWVHDTLSKRNGAEDMAALLRGGEMRMQAKDFGHPLLTIDEDEKKARCGSLSLIQQPEYQACVLGSLSLSAWSDSQVDSYSVVSWEVVERR